MGCGAVPAVMMWPDPKNHNEDTMLCPACPTREAPFPPFVGDVCCERAVGYNSGCPNSELGIPLFHNTSIIEQPVDLDALSDKYGAAAETFIGDATAAGDPFFLFYAPSHMHVPQNHDPRWTNASVAAKERGPFGAALVEMDNEVGRLVMALKTNDIFDHTLVLVTGDNGPWECKCNLTGSNGPFKGQWQKNNGGGSSAKTTLWEGGHRVVGIAHWPGRIAAGGVSNALASSLDYFPTVASLAGLDLPGDRSFDGIDLSPVLFGSWAPKEPLSPLWPLTAAGSPGTGDGGHRDLFHPLSGACGYGALNAVRQGRWKAIWSSGGAKGCLAESAECISYDDRAPLLFDLVVDPAEEHALDISDPMNMAVVDTLRKLRDAKMEDINNTPRSSVDYTAEPLGRLANCCNITHLGCACLPR